MIIGGAIDRGTSSRLLVHPILCAGFSRVENLHNGTHEYLL